MSEHNQLKRKGSNKPTSNFSGRTGKRRLLNAVLAQDIVGANDQVAQALIANGELESFPKRGVLTAEGASDNDLFLILSGSVAIKVHKRMITTRRAGTHVGELALADPLAKRSATVVAAEPTVTLRIAEHRFSNIANAHPDIWRRMVVQIGNRLRERNVSIRTPNNTPLLFIGSSSEGLSTAERIYDGLREAPVVMHLWHEDVFQASDTSIESLVDATGSIDFAALILTADDVTFSRRQKLPSPRDNVVFELGLFIGAIGRKRVLILKPRAVDIKIPSDLFGVTCIPYASRGKDSIHNVCARVEKIIFKMGPR
jgi:predicted nucleotide-binding protein